MIRKTTAIKQGEYMITYNDIKHNENIRTYIKKADEALGVLGYTAQFRARR